MKHFIKYLSTVLLIFIAGFSLTSSQLVKTDNEPTDDSDTTNIAIIEYTVFGMDSISINYVQDVLDTTNGVVFNFACWSDTVVFIEYDSMLTNKYRLMEVIKGLGYQPKIRSEN